MFGSIVVGVAMTDRAADLPGDLNLDQLNSGKHHSHRRATSRLRRRCHAPP
jgi:hypothetical protein